MFDLNYASRVQGQAALMKKEERVDRLDECCHAEMNVLTGSAHRRWVIPSTHYFSNLFSSLFSVNNRKV